MEEEEKERRDNKDGLQAHSVEIRSFRPLAFQPSSSSFLFSPSNHILLPSTYLSLSTLPLPLPSSNPPFDPSDCPFLLRQQITFPSLHFPSSQPRPLPLKQLPNHPYKPTLNPLPTTMHFLSTLAPLALLLSTSVVVDAAGHGQKRGGHRAAKRAPATASASSAATSYTGPTAAEVYAQDLKKFEKKSAPRKKRSTCSSDSDDSSSSNSTTTAVVIDAAVRPSSSAYVGSSAAATPTSSAAAAATTTASTNYDSPWALDLEAVSFPLFSQLCSLPPAFR